MTKDCLKYGFIGPEKSGKTFGVVWASRGEKTVIRLNPTHEDTLEKDAVIVHTMAELVAAIKVADGKKKTVICWNFPWTINPFDALDWACRVAAACPYRCAVVINEGETCFPKNAKSDAVERVIRMGRQHIHVPIYWTAQRPRDVSLRLRGNTNRWHFFRNDDETYVDFVKKKAGSEMAKAVQTLEQYHFIFKQDTGEPAKIVSDIKKMKS